MKKLLILIPMIFFIGCENPNMTTEKSVSDYVEKTYTEKLFKLDVFHLKCFYTKNGVMNAYYTDKARDNDFPAIIRFDKVGNTYSTKFDETYLNNKKQNLIDDIDKCMVEFNVLYDAKSTWK